jgi:hypothetical protein
MGRTPAIMQDASYEIVRYALATLMFIGLWILVYFVRFLYPVVLCRG